MNEILKIISFVSNIFLVFILTIIVNPEITSLVLNIVFNGPLEILKSSFMTQQKQVI